MENKQEQLVSLIEKLESKDFGFYFFTLDTKGNPVASIAYIYEQVKWLNHLGYKAYIMHEKNDYKLKMDPADPSSTMGISDWLGEEYANLPHISIEQQNLNLSATDFIIIPEVFSSVMKQVANFPCKKIVLSQAYGYILELLGVGDRWDRTYGFTDVITTSKEQAAYINELFRGIKTHIVPPSIPDYFKPTDKIKKPIIAIVTREQSDVLKLVKSFYLQYPMYNWVSFKELRGLPKETFAKELGEACLAIWVDDVSGFGTFPVEAIECETPVIGKIPNLIPGWMEKENEGSEITLKDNGIWTNNILSIPTLISKYLEMWLEDSVPQELLKSLNESKGQYTEEKQKDKIKEVYDGLVLNRKREFESLLEKEKIENDE